MKLPKSDWSVLFSPEGKQAASTVDEQEERKTAAPAASAPEHIATETSQAKAPASLSAAEPKAPEPSNDQGHAGNLTALLKKASPTLWAKLNPRTLSKRELRTKMLTLLEWLAHKNNVQATLNAPLAYVHEGQKIEGRLHALLKGEHQKAALELCFALDAASLSKLHHANLAGYQAILLWAGVPTPKADLLHKVAQLTQWPDTRWLEIVLLAPAPPRS